MYPGHVAGLKTLHCSAVITIVLSKDSHGGSKGTGEGSTDVLDLVEEGRGLSGGRWPFAEEEWFPLSGSLFFWLGHFLPHPRGELKSIMLCSSVPGGGKIK